MVEVNASFKSAQLSYTSLKTSSEKSSLAITEQRGNNPNIPPGLSNQEKQIIDDIGISQEAVQRFEDAKILANQLIDYLDYLNGNANDESTVQITAPSNANDNPPSVTIAGQSTKLSASIEVLTYKEETLDINAKFDDAGNLQELTVNKSSITAEYIKADFNFQETKFYAQA